MEALGAYGGSDSDDETPAAARTGPGRATPAETSETETEDEETPRGAPARLSHAAGAQAAQAAAAAAAQQPKKPEPPVGARIVVKPAPAVVLGDDPDAERAQDGAPEAAAAAPGAAAEEPPALSMGELAQRFLGPEVAAAAEGAAEGDAAALQERVAQTLTNYHQGGPHYVAHMRTNHAFRNPEILTKLVEMLGVDPYGSNFPAELFDPNGYEEKDFIGAIFEQQRAWLRKCEAARQQRGGGIDFVPSASEGAVHAAATAQAAAPPAAATTAGAEDGGPSRKRSKWGAAPADAVAGQPNGAAQPGTGNPYADFARLQREAAQGGAT